MITMNAKKGFLFLEIQFNRLPSLDKLRLRLAQIKYIVIQEKNILLLFFKLSIHCHPYMTCNID